MEEMECKEMLNNEQTNKLFDDNAVLISGDDVIAVDRVVELFGATPVACVKVHANRYHKRNSEDLDDFLTSWTTPDGTKVEFMTCHGFLLAVTYHNTMLQAEKEKSHRSVQREEAGITADN